MRVDCEKQRFHINPMLQHNMYPLKVGRDFCPKYCFWGPLRMLKMVVKTGPDVETNVEKKTVPKPYQNRTRTKPVLFQHNVEKKPTRFFNI